MATSCLQKSLIPRNSAVSSCDLRDSPGKKQLQISKTAYHSAEYTAACVDHVEQPCNMVAIRTSSILLAEQLVQKHADASKVNKLCHNKQVVMVFYDKPHEHQSLQRNGIIEFAQLLHSR